MKNVYQQGTRLLTPAWNFGVGGQSSGRQLVTGNLGLVIRRAGVQKMLLRKEVGNDWQKQGQFTEQGHRVRAGVNKQGNCGCKTQERGQL